MVKKSLRIIGVIVLIFTLVLFGIYFSFNETRPTGHSHKRADSLAQMVMLRLGKPAFDSARVIQWSFRNKHHYTWNKKEGHLRFEKEDITVLLDLATKKGLAFKKDIQMSDEDSNKWSGVAWANFCNDSFWLLAPFKMMDEGTKRSLVTFDDGREGLMVEYASGGVTPGDAYVWILDEQLQPIEWKMWVRIIPVGGISFTWDNYSDYGQGLLLASDHKGPFSLPITNIAIEF